MGIQLVLVLLATVLAYLPFGRAATCVTSNISPVPGSSNTYSICVDGKSQRSYLLFIPKNYDADKTDRSIIFSFHGGGRDAPLQKDLDRLTDSYFNEDAIVVYPQGEGDTWQGVPKVPPTDVDFTTELLTLLQSKLRIDKSRVYATGKSQGGGFVGVLACDAAASKVFAAFAPVSGAFYTDVPAAGCNPNTVKITCSPSRQNVPFIEFHGGADDTIRYRGEKRRGVCLPSIPHYITEWAVRNGLGSANDSAPYSMDTMVYSFGGGIVRGYYNKVIGHDWPATIRNSDNHRRGHVPASYNASEVIVQFFKKYTLP